MSETSPPQPEAPTAAESSSLEPKQLGRDESGPEVSPELEAVLERVLSLSMEQYRGPFPHPETLAGYERLYPGVTKQIFDDAHAQTTHRMAIERTTIEGDNFRATAGLFLGFAIAITGLVVAAIIGWRDQPGWAVAFGAVDLVGLVTVFVIGRRARLNELDDKAEDMTAPNHQRRRLRGRMGEARRGGVANAPGSGSASDESAS